MNELLNNIIQQIIEISLKYPELLNAYIRETLQKIDINLTLLINNNDCQDNLKILNDNIDLFIRFSLVMIYLSHKTGVTNSFVSNLILYTNIFLENLPIISNMSELKSEYMTNSLIARCFMLGTLLMFSKNTTSTNTILLNQIEISLYNLNLLFSRSNEFSALIKNSSLDEIASAEDFGSEFSMIKLYHSKKNFEKEKCHFLLTVYYQFTDVLLSCMKLHKDDINFEILFKRSVCFLTNIQKNFRQIEELNNSKMKVLKRIGNIN